MADSWNVPWVARTSLVGHHDSREPNKPWEPLVTDEPFITYATDTHGCLTVIAGARCRVSPRHHDGPCRVRVLSETGLVYTVAAGQSDTSAEPGWLPDLNMDNAALLARIGAALEVHAPRDYGTGEDHAVAFCVECHQPSPCATLRALAGVDVDLTEGVPA